MPAPRRRINIELLLGISATFLSLAALIVSIFQTQIAREQQQKSVLPYLQIRHEIADNTMQIILENKGVGPAFIHRFEIGHKKETAPDFDHFMAFELAKGQKQINRLGAVPNMTETLARKIIAQDQDMIIANDWFDASKDKDVIEAGTAMKEGDRMSIYEWRKKGNINGPFLNRLQRLIADSTYQIRVDFSDVYGNCWRLSHVRNRNHIDPLKDCPQ